jgi:hypothetical protein
VSDDPEATLPMSGPGARPLDGVPVHPQVAGLTLVTSPPLPAFMEGGFGRVYRAMTADGVLVAAKVPRPDMATGAAADLWLQECAQSRALPPHEHVVQFLPRTTARWPDGRETDALVMEWLEGARALMRYADDVGLDKVERIELLKQAVEGAAWMHSHGATHCDLKSGNMLVIERLGKPVLKVTDFGGTRSTRALDPRGAVGTASRAAPEVMRGDPAAITPRADVYSLSTECAELVGGPLAVGQESRDEQGEWRPRPMVQCLGLPDPGLDEIVQRGTQREPRDRYTDAGELLRALAEYRPPALERATRALEHWVWPRMQPRGMGVRAGGGHRAVLALAAIAAAGLVLSVLATWVFAGSGLRPFLRLPVEAAPTMANVLIVREKSPDGLATLARRLGIEGVNADAPVTKRLVWARVIERLAQAGPDAIAMDVAFRQSSDSAMNAVMVNAVAAASREPLRVPVVLATEDFEPGPPERRLENPLVGGLEAAGASWGCMNLTEFHSCGMSVVIPHRENAEPRLPLSVAAAAAAMGRNEGSGHAMPVRVDGEAKQLRFLGEVTSGHSVGLLDVMPARNLSDFTSIEGVGVGDIVGIYPVGVPSDEAMAGVDLDVLDLATESGQWNDLKLHEAVVFLAAYRADDVVQLDGREVPGVWMHAASTQALLSGVNAPQPSWWMVLPMAASVLAGLAVGAPMAAAVHRMVGLPLPTLAGRWPTSAHRARTLVRRWQWLALMAVLVTVGAPLVVHGLARAQEWALPFVPAACGVGAFMGAALGAVSVLAASWMGCVRRAWCLDRTGARGGHVSSV